MKSANSAFQKRRIRTLCVQMNFKKAENMNWYACWLPIKKNQCLAWQSTVLFHCLPTRLSSFFFLSQTSWSPKPFYYFSTVSFKLTLLSFIQIILLFDIRLAPRLALPYIPYKEENKLSFWRLHEFTYWSSIQ